MFQTLEKSRVIPSFSPIEEMKISRAQDGSIYYLSDTYLLLNMERIRTQLGDDTFNAYMRSLGRSSSSSQGIQDDSMSLETLKSRYLQSPGEIRMYLSSLQNRFYDTVDKELTKHKMEQEKKAALKQQEPQSTPQSNPTPAV